MYYKCSRSAGQRSRSQRKNVTASECCYMSETDRLTEFKLGVNYPRSMAQHHTHVQGHKVNCQNCNNSAADCLILLKFGTGFDHVTANILQMFKLVE